MIDCPHCKISFSPSNRVCPRCKAYKAKLDDRVEYLGHCAEAALDRGDTPADVEAMLVEEGVPALAACEMVTASNRKVKRAERSHGLIRLIGGSAILLASLVLILLGVLALPSPLGARLVVYGVLVGVAGAPPFALGLYSVVTGREKR